MGRTAELLRETEDYLRIQTREALEKCMQARTTEYRLKDQESAGEMPERSAYRINIACFNRNHTILRKRMLFELLNRLSPTGKDISAVHVTDTLELFEREGNRGVCLPFGIRARRQYGSVFLERRERGFVSGKISETANECPGAGTAGQSRAEISLGDEIFHTPFVYDLGDRGKIEFTGVFIKKGQEVPRKRYTKWFDYDKINECVAIRFRCQGDYLTIADRTGNMIRKSVKNYMVTEKIPRQIRDEIPVVAVGSHVVWLAGWRISEAFKVNENTERILQIKLLGAEFCEDGETEEKNGGEH